MAAASLAADLVVNTLPGHELGAEFGEALMFHPAKTALALDISYTPSPTAFLRAAARSGWRVTDGSGMLIEQGRAAFGLWFGKKPDGAPLRAVLESSL